MDNEKENDKEKDKDKEMDNDKEKDNNKETDKDKENDKDKEKDKDKETDKNKEKEKNEQYRIKIIAHRGASGMYPEHTALAYRYIYILNNLYTSNKKTMKWKDDILAKLNCI